MSKKMDACDCDGERVLAGDSVLYLRVTDDLLRGLPDEDQIAIKAQEGKTLKISAFDCCGRAEIEFKYEREDSEIIYHTIWVKPDCLKKIGVTVEAPTK